MAEWIKLHEKIIRDPVVIDQSERLNLDPRIIAWSWVTLWDWAREQTEDGFVARMTPARVDGIVNIKGFADHAGEWLAWRDGGVLFPKWDTHNSKGAKERAVNARRNKKHRAKALRDGSVTVPPSRDRCTDDDTRDACVTVAPSPEEKRREEKREEISPLPPKAQTAGAQTPFRLIDESLCRMFPSTVGTPANRSGRVSADIAEVLANWEGKVPSFDDWLPKALAHIEQARPTKWGGALGLLKALAGQKVDQGLDPGDDRPLNNVPLRVTNAKCDDAAVDAAVAKAFEEKPRRAAY